MIILLLADSWNAATLLVRDHFYMQWLWNMHCDCMPKISNSRKLSCFAEWSSSSPNVHQWWLKFTCTLATIFTYHVYVIRTYISLHLHLNMHNNIHTGISVKTIMHSPRFPLLPSSCPSFLLFLSLSFHSFLIHYKNSSIIHNSWCLWCKQQLLYSYNRQFILVL